MPKRISAEEAKRMGLIDAPQGPGPAPTRKKISASEAASMGLVPSATQSHGSSRSIPDSLTEEGGLSHGPGTSFALNALDSLSLVGLPTVLGMKDALTGDAKDGDFRTRYRKAKEKYEGGMSRLSGSNPKTALAGQLAPVVVPGGAMASGAKILPTMGRGVLTGAAAGGLRGGARTLDGDIAGTMEDATIGGIAGGVLAGVGGLAGKVVEKGGDMARKTYGGVLAEMRKRTGSDVGRAGKYAQEGAGAVENAWNKRAMDDDAAAALIRLRQRRPGAKMPSQGAVPGVEHRDPAQVRRLLGRREGNADAAMDQEQALFDRYGQSLRKPIAQLNAEHLADIGKESTGHIKRAAIGAAMGAAGYKAGEAAGFDPRITGAIAGSGGIYAARKISQAVASHPETLKKLMKLTPVGQALSRGGAKAASTPQNVAAIVYALRKDPAVAQVLKEYEDQNGGE